MVKLDREKLLQVKEVVEEINRHKWLQSEMVGYDVGFDKAADSWFDNYATAWVAYHLPKFGKEPVKAAKKKA
ncbi:MAG: DUF4032 domain-containing protein [Candidatus Omnitrophica bacterium]|nr:DUF4032 domain-containing protein [Candidatus Omnitrophota bacterium]